MSVYRENARWGALVSEHRASAASWFAAAALAAAISAGVLVALPRVHQHTERLWIAAIVFPLLGAWMLVVALGLQKIRLRVFERGLAFADARGEHEAEWSEIRSVEERSSERGRLLAIALAVPSGTIVLPRELHGFDQVRALLDKRVTAPRTQVTISAMNR